MELARLEPVDLRMGWPHEASAFTPWLADSANLALLAETLGLRLEPVETEVNVGPFRADLLCREVMDDHLVLIENQLERTDHTHLGQILTYVAGLGIRTVIWIAAVFTDEHRAALDWLNDATDERYRFFGITVELWRIGDSAPAPRFNLVVQPNDWSRVAARIGRAAQGGERSEIGQRRLAYWTGFHAYLETRGRPVGAAKPNATSNLTFATAHPHLTLKTYRATSEVGAFIRVDGPERAELFRRLQARQAEIEADFGAPVQWLTRERGAFYWIVRSLPADPDDELDWPRQFAFIENAMAIFTAFLDRLGDDWSAESAS